MGSDPSNRFGPLLLAPGVTRFNVLTNFYASTALLGQEAPVPERGAIMAMNGLFGSIGIMIFTKGGGMWFDTWGPWAPFVVIGVVQSILLLVAIGVRIIAPGRGRGELQVA